MKNGKTGREDCAHNGRKRRYGFDTAKEFISEGAFVFITGRRKVELDRAVESLGDRASAIQADAGKLQDLDRMYAEIKEKRGKLDVVFANPGIYEQMPYDKVTEDFYDQCADINAKGVFFTIQKAIALMNNNGSIIFNGSFIGSSGFRVWPCMERPKLPSGALRAYSPRS